MRRKETANWLNVIPELVMSSIYLTLHLGYVVYFSTEFKFPMLWSDTFKIYKQDTEVCNKI